MRVTVEEIAEEDLIVLKSGYGLRDLIELLFADSGLRPRIRPEADEHTPPAGSSPPGSALTADERIRPIDPAGGRSVERQQHPLPHRPLAGLRRAVARVQCRSAVHLVARSLIISWSR